MSQDHHNPGSTPLDGGHGGHGEDTRPPAAPNPPPPGPAVSDEGIRAPIQKGDYLVANAEFNAGISESIDLYFNNQLNMFPYWGNEKKPDRFHVLFQHQIEERFPVDDDIRRRIHAYGRRVFRALCVHVGVKRLTQLLSLIALAVLVTLGPTQFVDWTGDLTAALGLSALGMLVTVGLFCGASSILFVQYRFRLENDTYELSREIVERTRELQNQFTAARALSDQAETQFATDGKGWGARALYLTRLIMWFGARMEYLEKYTQMELWRVRRERYWMRWFAGITTPLLLLIWLAALATLPAPAADETGFRVLQGVAALLGVLVSWLSFFVWRTPIDRVQEKLGVDSWVRFNSLDVDNAVGEQVQRDKERLVEYRILTRGGR